MKAPWLSMLWRQGSRDEKTIIVHMVHWMRVQAEVEREIKWEKKHRHRHVNKHVKSSNVSFLRKIKFCFDRKYIIVCVIIYLR